MKRRVPDIVMMSGAAEPAWMESTMRDLVAASSEVLMAVQHVRLSALHRVIDALERADHCRLVLARLDLHMLDGSRPAGDAGRDNIERLLTFAGSGRLEIRSAGAMRWAPDFSVFQMRDRRCGMFCLFGAHYLAPPHPGLDWPLTCLLTRRTVIAEVEYHFRELWDAAHDALGPVAETLERRLWTTR